MAASTLVSRALTNDTGTAANPNADGTILNDSWFQTLRSDINALLSGAGSYATITFGGLIAAEGFGGHIFSAGGTGEHNIQVRNTTAGTGNLAGLRVGNDGALNAGTLVHFSSTYTTSGQYAQDSFLLEGIRAGGLGLSATHASGTIRFYTTNAERARIAANGQLLLIDGAEGDPAVSFLSNADSGIYLNGGTLYMTHSASTRFSFGAPSGTLGNNISLFAQQFGTGNHAGSSVFIGANVSGGGAAGYLELQAKNGTTYQIWVDAAGKLRISSGGAPEEDGTPSDTSGTIVGTQS